MAFEGLSEKLSAAFKKLRGKGRLTESDIKEFYKKMKKGKPNPENCVTLDLFVISMRRR